MQDIADADLPLPWRPLPMPKGYLGLIESVEDEIRREAANPSHLLYGVRCRLVAWSEVDHNEFLMATDRPGMPLAFVHLTGQIETKAEWPWTVGYPSLEAFRAAWV